MVDDDLLRHLASEIGHDWRHLAHSLGIRRVRLQAILRNHGTNESQQTVYEMLVSWMKKLPRAVNKVKYITVIASFTSRCLATSRSYVLARCHTIIQNIFDRVTFELQIKPECKFIHQLFS